MTIFSEKSPAAGQNSHTIAEFLDSRRPPAAKVRSRPDPADLRRRSVSGRDAAQRCIDRARHLQPSDRAALLAVYRDGMTVKDLAALHAESDLGTRALRRRLKRTSARILTPKFDFVTSFLEPCDQDERRRLGLPCWSTKRRAVAERCVVQGLSMREASIALGVSLHSVRHEMSTINAIFESRGAGS